MSTFTCHLCWHDHDTRDQLLGNVCGWCGDGSSSGIYAAPDPGDHILTL